MAFIKREITLEEVQKHNTPDDLWMIINDRVYSLSEFLNEHPGGEEPLTENAGRDATREFLDVGHSKEAEEIMKKYYVGDLAEADKKKNQKNNGCSIKKYKKEIGLGLAGIALGILTIYVLKYALSNRN